VSELRAETARLSKELNESLNKLAEAEEKITKMQQMIVK